MISQRCVKEKFCSKISILLCNMFYGEMWRERWILSSLQGNVATIEDLISNQKVFSNSLNYLSNSTHDGLKFVLVLSYVKLYLYHYVQIMDPTKEIFKKISDQILGEGGLMKSLRLYCLKVLRKNKKTKDIHTEYIKTSVFSWIDTFK